MHMGKSFQIIDGTMYVDKQLFYEAQEVENNISRLTGSFYTDFFKTKPKCITGQETVIIDYHNVDEIIIEKDSSLFVEELRDMYHSKVRGHLVICQDDGRSKVITINRY